MKPVASAALGSFQKVALVTLRFAIGWHLFLQGYGKLAQPGWSAGPYLARATGPLADLFHALGGQRLAQVI